MYAGGNVRLSIPTRIIDSLNCTIYTYTIIHIGLKRRKSSQIRRVKLGGGDASAFSRVLKKNSGDGRYFL